MDPPYSLILTNGAAPPVLNSGVLTIDTDEIAKNAFYIQAEPLVDTDQSFTVEFGLKVLSDSSINPTRTSVLIAITIRPSFGTLLAIGIDEVFFNIANNVAGDVVTVDTDDQIHDYRLEYDGIGEFVLFQDGVQILSAPAYSSAVDHGQDMRIIWGEVSTAAFGASEWTTFGHDSAAALVKDGFESQ